MLFSHPEVSKYIRENLVAAWQSMRPVPTATIDFGDGRKVVRTMNGNVATYVCDPDGRVIDVIAGLVSPQRYLAELQAAVSFWARSRDLASEVPRWHTELGASKPAVLIPLHMDAGGIASTIDPLATVGGAPTVEFESLSKSAVELPTKAVFGLVSVSAAGGGVPQIGALAAQIEAGPGADAAATRFPSKLEIERPSKRAFGPEALLLAQEDAIERTQRKPAIHALLAERLVESKDIEKRLFREVLHVDLDDPCLGLAIVVFDGGAYRGSD